MDYLRESRERESVHQSSVFIQQMQQTPTARFSIITLPNTVTASIETAGGGEHKKDYVTVRAYR
jgi:hypothetical protein